MQQCLIKVNRCNKFIEDHEFGYRLARIAFKKPRITPTFNTTNNAYKPCDD